MQSRFSWVIAAINNGDSDQSAWIP